MFIEVLKEPALLSLCLQNSDCDIVYGLKQLLKTVNSLKSLREKHPLEWSTVKLVRERIVTEGSSVNYQGATIKNHNVATLEYYKKQAVRDLERYARKIGIVGHKSIKGYSSFSRYSKLGEKA